jgi:AraC-like DNA-binding protein
MHHGAIGAPNAADRTIQDMVVVANAMPGAGGTELADGWRRPLSTGAGFRYSYHRDIGDGGWEFHYLSDAVSIVVADFTAAQPISRMHRLDDHLVFSAVLEGRIPISSPEAPDAELADGFCTVYGLARGEPLKTVYEPGRALRWVSVLLRRDKLHNLCGLDSDAMPSVFRDFVIHGAPTGLRSVPLSGEARMAALQIFNCDYSGELRRLYLTAKAIEIVCTAVHALNGGGPAPGQVELSKRDIDKVWAARGLIEQNLDDPLTVDDLARAVGVGRRKLQLGFQQTFNGAVGQVYQQARHARAMALVGETRLPLIEIALECGYEHAASFTRAFKAAFGQSPLRVRAMLLRERASTGAITGQARLRRH